MKKILFFLMVPMLLLCTACSSDEDIDEMQSDAFVAYVYSLALRVVTPEGDNLVSTLPCVENSIELSEYKVEPITLPTKFGGNLSKWETAEYDEFIRFIYRHTNAVDPQRNCTFKITYPKLFGDKLEHVLETEWIQDSPPMIYHMQCTRFTLDGKEYPVTIDKSQDLKGVNSIVKIELNR